MAAKGDMLSIHDLTKRFGHILAVDDISFSVARGEVLGFLGPNGAGKTTTMRLVTGFLTPTKGRIELDGVELSTGALEVKARIGYLPEGAPGYPDMTPSGFLGFVAAARGFVGAEKRRRIDRAVQLTELESVLNQPIDTLSKGFRRRVGLAQALLHDPEVLILDEPTDGLDPNQKHQVRELISRMAPDKAIVISTHILEEVEAVCTRALIIANGRLIADGTPAEFVARARDHNAVYLTVPSGEAPRIRAALSAHEQVSAVEEVPHHDGGIVALRVLPRDRTRAILGAVGQAMRDGNWPVHELRLEQGRFDDVFRSITTSYATEAVASDG
ncbi:MAG: ABC transporter ATP-binding protein [Kiloniellales bacterium]